MVCFLKRPHMPSHPLSFFLLDLLSFERPDALPTICALAVKVSSAIAIAASNPLHRETTHFVPSGCALLRKSGSSSGRCLAHPLTNAAGDISTRTPSITRRRGLSRLSVPTLQ
jgi:hypothetical protein